MHARLALLVGVVLLACAGSLAGQLLPSGLPVIETPVAVGFAGGGLAADGDAHREAYAPVRSAAPSAVFASVASRRAAVRATFLTVGLSGRLHSTRFGLALHWANVTGIADDPTVAAGLRIGDVRMQASLGRMFARDKVGVSVTVAQTWTTVFGTAATTFSFGSAASLQISKQVRVVAHVDDAGPATRYRAESGTATPRSQYPLVHAGVGLRPSLRLPLNLYVDLRRRTGPDRATAAVASGDFTIGGVLLARAGVRVQSDAGDRPALVPGAGFRIRLGSLALDYGFAGAASDYDLAPEHHFSLTWTR